MAHENSAPAKAQPAGKLTWARTARRIRVPLSFALGVVYFWLAQPTALGLITGLAVAAVGLALRAAAAGHVRKDRELTTSGPYAYTRNPLYLGSFIMAAGFAIAARSLWIVLAIAGLLVAIYWPLVRAEEAYLRQHFAGFDDYAARVPRLLPRISIASSNGRFSRELYLRHREYRALLGTLAMAAALIVKMWWRHS